MLRLFLVGCPRSGTTLLQGMLAAHPQIESFPETHFFSKAYPKNSIKRFLTWPALNVLGVLDDFLIKIGRSDLMSEVDIGFLDRNYEKSFTRILDKLTSDACKDIWLEKTPRHLHFIPEIEARVPNTKFIHILRSGVDVIASLYEVTHKHPDIWGGGWSIDLCIDRWIKDVHISLDYSQMKNHIVLRYEHLIKSPKTDLVNLCNWLGIKYSNDMLEARKGFSNKIVLDSEPWKTPVGGEIRIATSRKFYNVLNPAQQRYIINRLSECDIDDPIRQLIFSGQE